MRKVTDFAEIEQEFSERVKRVIWANVATVDSKNRPRSRLMHPVWERLIGWVSTRPHTLKIKHLAQNPFVSVAYVTEPAKPVYAECYAELIQDLEEKQRIWNFFKNTPEPVGFDPATMFPSYDDPGFGVLKLTPWRIELSFLPEELVVWENPEAL